MPLIQGRRLCMISFLYTALVAIPFVYGGIACLTNPCYHGICIDDINSTYSCYCTDGYTGIQCQTNWDECWSDPCQNGGTCVDGVATYNCTCPDGFIGDNCEINYNECESNPCLNNGTCIDMTNEYVCHCVPGFSGDHCEADAAVCNSTEEVRCYNGGECVEGPGYKFYCKCSAGWTGSKCEDQIDECISNPCRNGGICIDAHADYMCACTYGFTGKSCEVQIQFCDENTCSNEAICVVEDGERICYCVPDYHGERCELQYDECLLGPRCLNGGTCIDGVDNFTCSCPPKLTGALCECLILDDGSDECNYITSTSEPVYNITEETTFTVKDSTLDESLSKNYTKHTSTESTTRAIAIVSTEQTTTTSFTATNGNKYDTTTEEITPSLTTVTDIEMPNYTVATTKESSSEVSVYTTSESDDRTETSKSDTTEYIEITTVEVTIPSSDLITRSNSTTDSTEVTLPPIETTTMTDTTIKNYTITSKYTRIPEDSLGSTVSLNTIQDTTTEKMFTDNPGDSSPWVTISTSMPSDIEETKSILDTTTDLSSTTPSECVDAFCNNHGTCHSGLHGVRCQCVFNYAGKNCEDKISIKSAAFDGNSYVVHRIQNSTTIDIEFTARTLITNGQIMHVDIARGVYMELYMIAGLLKFQFSCGYQTMLLSELKTYVNKGFPMKIETRLDLYMKEQHCNATLRLNDTLAMSGGQVANISSIDHDTTIHIGSAMFSNHSENRPFIGCIENMKVNGRVREVFGDAVDASEVSECSSLPCLSAPCLNGGSCSDFGNTYVCSCSNGWMGNSCNQSICDHNPCQSGGSCVVHPGSGFLCLCPYGKHGIFCEYNVEISRPSLAPIGPAKSSYVMYGLTPSAMNSDRFDLRLRFQTTDMDQIALLAFVGQNGRHDSKSQHLALTFVKGYLMLTWNMGSGARRVFTSRAARRGAHSVRVWRRGRSAGLTLDARTNVTGNAPAPHNRANLTLTPYVYIGGHPAEGFHDLPHDLPLHSGWTGCIWDVGGQSVSAAKIVAGRGVGQCGVSQCTSKSCNAPRGVCIHSPATYGCICNEGWLGPTCNSHLGPCDPKTSECRGRCVLTVEGSDCDCPYGKSGKNCEEDMFPIDIHFTGKRSYITLPSRSVSSISLSLEAEIKPFNERGLIIYVETPHFYTALSLQGGLLEYRWTDRASGLTSLVRSGAVVPLRQWHAVRAGRYGDRLYVWADGALSTEPLLAHAYPHTASDAHVAIGGATDLSKLPVDVVSGPPESYAGCFRNFHINNVPISIDKQTIREAQNIGACEGAQCESAGGARCRRGACASMGCGRAACYRGRCLCPSGRAGDHCETRVNITIPQFDGEASLSLTRGAATLSGRLHDPHAPDRLALNFNTAEPDGLILWIDMTTTYLGLGLDKGYVKIVSCSRNNRSNETQNKVSTSRNRTTTIVQAGFLADGDWHTLLLVLKDNVTITIDELVYFVDDLHFNYTDTVNDVFLGGVNTEDETLRSQFPQNFKGCIDRISTRDETYLSDYASVYSENIQSCHLFPST